MYPNFIEKNAMKSIYKAKQLVFLILFLTLGVGLSSMSACLRCRVGRGFNPSNIVVYDSIYFANGYYGYWYSYELGSFCGSIGDFISISITVTVSIMTIR